MLAGQVNTLVYNGTVYQSPVGVTVTSYTQAVEWCQRHLPRGVVFTPRSANESTIVYQSLLV